MPQADPGDDPAVVKFVASAKELCRVLELKRRRSKRTFAEQILKSTLALYGAGMELPDVHPESGYSPLGEWFEKHKHMPLEHRMRKDPRVREHAKPYATIKKQIIASLDNKYCYRTVFEPFDPNTQTISTTLADDLADIYCDVKQGILQVGKHSEVVSVNVVWQWKFGLQSHWGRHAVSAIAALHSLLFGEHALR
jgi:Domain of unknown function (DUF5063)